MHNVTFEYKIIFKQSNAQVKIYIKVKGTKVQRLVDFTHSEKNSKRLSSIIIIKMWNVISKLNIETHEEFKTSKYHIYFSVRSAD